MTPTTTTRVVAYALAFAVLGTVAFLAGVRLGETLDGPLAFAGLIFHRVGWVVAGYVVGAAVGLFVGVVRGRPFSVMVAGGLAGALLWSGGPDQPWLRIAVLAAVVGLVGGSYIAWRRAPTKAQPGAEGSAEPKSPDALVVTLTLLLIGPAFAGNAEQGRADQWIRQLGSATFAEREAAAKELDRLGEAALGSLRKAAASDKDPEVRRRAGILAQEIEGRPLRAFVNRTLSQGWTWPNPEPSLDACIRRHLKGFTVERIEADHLPGGYTQWVRVKDHGRVVLRFPASAETTFTRSGDVLYLAVFYPLATGCSVRALDLRTGKERWKSELQGLGQVGHSKYRNQVAIDADGVAVVVRGKESYGRYIEVLDPRTGRTVGHKVFDKQSW